MSDGTPESRGQRLVGDWSPRLAEIIDDVVFGEVWERPGLSPRERSLVTVAALTSLGAERELAGHLRRAAENGVTEQEVGELLLHLSFYLGTPRVLAAAAAAREGFPRTTTGP